MSSKERVFRALKREEPDRVPTFEWIIDPNVISSIMPGAGLFDFLEQAEHDAVVIGPNYRFEKINEKTYRDEWGVVMQKSAEAVLHPLEKEAPIKHKDDLRSYKCPAPASSWRFDKLDRAIERFKGKKAIVFKVRDVVSTPRDLLGFTTFLMSTVSDANLVKEIICLSISHYLAVIDEAVKRGAEIIVTGDDFADKNGPLVSPDTFENLFLPEFKRFVSYIKKTGAYFIKHTDGNIMPIIDMILDAQIDCLDPIDPLAGMDIAEVKKKYGKKIALKGNIDCANLLTYSDENEVIDEVKKCIMAASIGGGHIISSSNSIHSGVKPGNYMAMLRAIKEYGTYPIDIENIKNN